MRWSSTARDVAQKHRSRPPLTRLVAGGVLFALGCASSQPRSSPAHGRLDPGAVRYRLLLRENPVDPGGAFRCYGRCQSAPTPGNYLQCLTECPGFEVTPGIRCGEQEVPPMAACFTVRKVDRNTEVQPGYVVLAVLAEVVLIVSLASVCASSSAQCGYWYAPYPPPR